MKKRLISPFLAFLFAFSTLLMPSFAYATANNDDILLANGFFPAEIKSLSEEKKANLVYELINNPENVQSISYTVEIDDLKIMRDFTNYDDDKLISMGYDENFISANREVFASYLKMDTSELSESLDITEDTATAIKQTLSGCGIQPFTISPSKLDFHMTVRTYSTPNTGYKVQYSIVSGFRWLSQPMIALTTGNGEEMAFTWGYGPGVINYASVIEYHVPGGTVFDKTALAKITYGVGAKFSWCWVGKENGKEGYAESGAVSFDIANTTYSGYLTTLTGIYGHNTLGISGPGISITVLGTDIGVLPSVTLDPTHYEYTDSDNQDFNFDIRI